MPRTYLYTTEQFAKTGQASYVRVLLSPTLRDLRAPAIGVADTLAKVSTEVSTGHRRFSRISLHEIRTPPDDIMRDDSTSVAGFVIPSSDPLFLAIVAIHVLLGLGAVGTGLVAMLSTKAPGRHPRFGTLYFWLLTTLFLSATALSIMRWEHAYHLFLLGAFSFLTAFIGRTARRRRTHSWKPVHIVSMGSSYVLMLIAFYVDNGKQLPPLDQLPPWTYWAFPILIGVPIIIGALLRHLRSHSV